MTKAVIYARVSSDEQQKEGFSIPAQIDLLKSYAEKNNIEVVKTYEESQTAKQAGRAKFNEMLSFLHAGKDVNTILVEKTDRLYRNFKDYVLIDENKFEIHLVKENEIIGKNATSHQKFVHGIKVLMAKNYIDNLSEEVRKGRLKKVKEGYFIGRVPYGYKKLDPRTSVIDEEKAPFVRRAFELYAQGDLSLDKPKDRIRLRESKTNKFKDFPISDNAKSAIKEYLRTRIINENEPLFQSRKNKGFLLRQQAYRILNDVAKSVGIKDKIGTHTLRKTFGYHAHNNGYDITLIQKLFNHSSPSITLRYIGITQDALDDVYLSLDL